MRFCGAAGGCLAGPVPAVVGLPVTGDGYELQEELHTGEPVEDLGGLPVEPQRAILDEELHHLHHLLPAGRTCLKNKRTPTKVNFPLTIFPLEQSDNDSGSMLCNYLLSMFCLYQRYVM